jgi:hypothetical protein
VQDDEKCAKVQGEEQQTCVRRDGGYNNCPDPSLHSVFLREVPIQEISLREWFKDLQHHPAVDQSPHRLPNDRVHDG